jgi:hypothetical protein
MRRHAAGGIPTPRLNTRVKWLWSANPQWEAINAIGWAVRVGPCRHTEASIRLRDVCRDRVCDVINKEW